MLNGEQLTSGQLENRKAILADLAYHYTSVSCCREHNWREIIHSMKYEQLVRLCQKLFHRECKEC